jgi:subtilisin family serine protease
MYRINLILWIFIPLFSFAQEDAWVFFNNKPEADYYLENPLEMLSQRALDRRENQNIELDFTDVPIHEAYVNQVENATGISVRAKSKWLNCVHVQGSVTDIQNLTNLSFVDHIEYANPNALTRENHPPQYKPVNKWGPIKSPDDFDYGEAYNQVHMLNVDYLHNQGYTGQGMIIAVIDAGFEQVNTLSGFARIRNNGQILGTYNFVNGSNNVYSGTSSYHGSMVLSTIAGYIEGQFAGTAPDAEFYLFVSEDATAEYILEESLWVEAAEEADRLGVDVVNTSLGYSIFDNPEHSHTYSDMDGETTIISRAAEILSTKGIILCNSAGNSGDNQWHYITAPADADGILTVGAVNGSEDIAYFSSYGPSSDGRIKPDVCAQGQNAIVITGDDSTSPANGTSFSSPIMTGSVASFWQAFPNMTNLEIMQAVRESADRYNNPDDHYGYGIPDFMAAYNTLIGIESYSTQHNKLYPNPVSPGEKLFFDTPSEIQSVHINGIQGGLLWESSWDTPKNSCKVPELPNGIYWIQMKNTQGETQYNKLIIK